MLRPLDAHANILRQTEEGAVADEDSAAQESLADACPIADLQEENEAAESNGDEASGCAKRPAVRAWPAQAASSTHAGSPGRRRRQAGFLRDGVARSTADERRSAAIVPGEPTA